MWCVVTRILPRKVASLYLSRTQVSLWIESSRIDDSTCSLGMGVWGGSFNTATFQTLGRLPNYSIAAQSMVEALLFQGQEAQPSIQPNKINFEEVQIAQTHYQEKMASMKNSITEAEHSYETESIRFLAEAYKMLFAAAADLHYLKYGVMPLLPLLVRDKVFNMENQYIRAATGEILSFYFSASIEMANTMPEHALLIWLGMSETFVAIGEIQAAQDSLLEVIKHLARTHRLLEPASLQNAGDILHKVSRSLDNDTSARLKQGFTATALSHLSACLDENTPKRTTETEAAICVPDWLQSDLTQLSKNVSSSVESPAKR